jgi:hypothetical protein
MDSGQFRRFKRRIQSPKQVALAEWFQQALHRTALEQSWAEVAFAVSRHEDDRNRLAAPNQFTVQVWSAHSWHGNVKDQTLSFGDEIGRQERFRGRKYLDCKSALSQ